MEQVSATPVRRGPPGWIVAGFLTLGIAAVVAAFFIPITKRDGGPKETSAVIQPPEYPAAPIFLLTERSGKEISNADLDGKIWIASFQYSRCKYCPSVAATMAKLQRELKLKERDDLRFVTFTIDPDHDTPDELKKYADRFDADPTKWLFLHGKEKYLHLLARRGFQFALNKTANPDPGLRFDHSLKLVLVDGTGQIRGTFDGMAAQPDESLHVSDKDLADLRAKFEASYASLKAMVAELSASAVGPRAAGP